MSPTDPLPQVVIFPPQNSNSPGKKLKTKVEQTGPASIRATIIPDSIGIHLIRVTTATGSGHEYRSNIVAPKNVRILRGFDQKSGEFVPELAPDVETHLVFGLENAGNGKLEAELILPSGDRSKVDVHTVKER